VVFREHLFVSVKKKKDHAHHAVRAGEKRGGERTEKTKNEARQGPLLTKKSLAQEGGRRGIVVADEARREKKGRKMSRSSE